MTTITKEDLIRYFKGETSREKRNQIREAIRTDSELKEAYFLLTRMQEPLHRAIKTPPDQIIHSLIKYGRIRQKIGGK